MPKGQAPRKPTPKTRAGYAKNAWDESMKRAAQPTGSGKANPATYVVGAMMAGNAAITKKDPFAKPLKKPAKKGK